MSRADPRCPYPWQCLNIAWDGQVRPCCYTRRQDFGNLRDSGIEAIWNGSVWRSVRRAWRTGDLTGSGCEDCRLRANQGLPPLFRFPRASDDPRLPVVANFAINEEEYWRGEEQLASMPSVLSYSPGTSCDIRCVMCYQHQERHRRIDPACHQRVEALLPYLQQFSWGGGEPLVQPEFRRFLESFRPPQNPNLGLALVTNGQGLTLEIVRLLTGAAHAVVNVSIDACRKSTYEKIRQGGTWERLEANLGALLKARAEHQFLWVSASFLWQKLNFHELPAYLAWCRQRELPTAVMPLDAYPIPLRIDVFNDAARECEGFEATVEDALQEAGRLDRAVAGRTSFVDGKPYASLPFVKNCAETIRAAVARARTYARCSGHVTGASGPCMVLARSPAGEVLSYAFPDSEGRFTLRLPRGVGTRWEVWDDMYCTRRLPAKVSLSVRSSLRRFLGTWENPWQRWSKVG